MQLSVMIFQSYAEKQALGEVSQDILDTQVNPGVWEIGGHVVLKRKKDFEDASEGYAWRLLAQVSLSEERFDEVKACILEVIGVPEDGCSEIKPPPPRRASQFPRDHPIFS